MAKLLPLIAIAGIRAIPSLSQLVLATGIKFPRIIRELRPGSKRLTELSRLAKDRLLDLHVTSFYETEPFLFDVLQPFYSSLKPI
jgi:hypothetical protein